MLMRPGFGPPASRLPCRKRDGVTPLAVRHSVHARRWRQPPRRDDHRCVRLRPQLDGARPVASASKPSNPRSSLELGQPLLPLRCRVLRHTRVGIARARQIALIRMTPPRIEECEPRFDEWLRVPPSPSPAKRRARLGTRAAASSANLQPPARKRRVSGGQKGGEAAQTRSS